MGKLVRKMTIPYYIMQLENGDVNPSFVITIKKKKTKVRKELMTISC